MFCFVSQQNLSFINMDNVSITANMLIFSTCIIQITLPVSKPPQKNGHRSCSQVFGQVGIHFLEEGPASLGSRNSDLQPFILGSFRWCVVIV